MYDKAQRDDYKYYHGDYPRDNENTGWCWYLL